MLFICSSLLTTETFIFLLFYRKCLYAYFITIQNCTWQQYISIIYGSRIGENPKCSRGDQRGENERLHVKLITIGPYRRRKRSDLNPSTSVRCEGIGKNFFLNFFEENETFYVILSSFFCPTFWEDMSTSFWSYIFLCIFSCLFGIRLCIFCNNLVFTLCLYCNYIYVLFFQILTFLKLCLVFAKLLKN